MLRHGLEIAAAGEPAADHNVERLIAQHMKHDGQDGLVVLKVTIHDRDIWRCTRQNAFNAGRSQTAPADTLDAAYVRMAPRKRAHSVGGAVRGIVVDKHHFPSYPSEHLPQPL